MDLNGRGELYMKFSSFKRNLNLNWKTSFDTSWILFSQNYLNKWEKF